MATVENPVDVVIVGFGWTGQSWRSNWRRQV
jgi:hypothetical protein